MKAPQSTFTKTAKLIVALAPTDAVNIVREALFLFVILLPVVVALILRFLLPELEKMLIERLQFDLAPYHPMIMGVFIGVSPSLIGSLYGLLLVDERDERTLSVLRIMPTPFATYLTARLLIPTALAVFMTILTYPLAGLSPLPILTVTAIALAGATVVPVAALVIVSIATNKISGLVVFRLVTSVLALPALAYIAPPDWDRLAWIISAYWPMKALWLASDGQTYGLELLIAPVMNLALALILYRRFASRP
jgi:hypothetical protein